jgi:hypothetical protein
MRVHKVDLRCDQRKDYEYLDPVEGEEPIQGGQHVGRSLGGRHKYQSEWKEIMSSSLRHVGVVAWNNGVRGGC